MWLRAAKLRDDGDMPASTGFGITFGHSHWSRSSLATHNLGLALLFASLPAARKLFRGQLGASTARLYAAAFFARYAAQRFLAASIMRFRPAALIRRFLASAFGSAVFPARAAAQRFFCAEAMRCRAAALRMRFGVGEAPDLVTPSLF